MTDQIEDFPTGFDFLLDLNGQLILWQLYLYLMLRRRKKKFVRKDMQEGYWGFVVASVALATIHFVIASALV